MKFFNRIKIDTIDECDKCERKELSSSDNT
jgi:hypothetical protein